MEVVQSAIDLSFINDKSDEEIAKENEERKYKKKERNREYQRAWRQRQRDLKIKVSKEEKQEKKRKRHRENQRAYYQRIKAKMSTTDEQTLARKKKRAERARAYRQRKKLIAEQSVHTESDGSSNGSSYVMIRPECVMTCGEPCQEGAIPIQDNRSVMKAKAQEIELYVKPQTPETSINAKKTPVQVIHDPIPLVEPPKEMLEVSVPSMHTEAAVDVMIKEEPIDIHMETVGALCETDACVKKETVHQECDVNVMPDSSLQVSVTVKQECVDEDEGERGLDGYPGEYSNSGNSEHCYSRTHDTGPANTREEKHKELKKELKRKRNRERQRAYYQRQKNLKKNEEKKKVPKTNAERQREFRQRKAELCKSYVNIKRRKLCSNEENVVQESPIQVIHDPIPLVEPPKEMLEVTVPSMHTEGPVDVMIKEEPIDIHMETVGALRGTDACVKKETVHHEGDVDVMPDSSLQVSVTVKQESVDEDEGERGADVCSGEYSNSGNSEHCYSRTHDTGPAKTRKSTEVSTTKVQDKRSQKKTNAQKCKEYREKQKLQNIHRSDECYEGDQLHVKKPKSDKERSKAYYDRQKLKKPKLKKAPKTAAQRSKEYRKKQKLKKSKIQKQNTDHLPIEKKT